MDEKARVRKEIVRVRLLDQTIEVMPQHGGTAAVGQTERVHIQLEGQVASFAQTETDSRGSAVIQS